MKQDQVQKELTSLLGKEVSFRRIAGNSIILYFGGQPGDDAVTTLRIEPSWRYLNTGKWILGSGDLPWEKEEDETDDEYFNRFNKICDLCKPITNSIVELVSLSPDSSDMELVFCGDQKLCSFSGCTDDYSWSYNNRKKGIKIYGSPNGYEEKST